jgi:CO/xanthine dehydrogenase Mo-binding subunit
VNQITVFGAKGVGLAGTINLFQAAGNAIHDAIGVWIKDYPIALDQVLKILGEKEE